MGIVGHLVDEELQGFTLRSVIEGTGDEDVANLELESGADFMLESGDFILLE